MESISYLLSISGLGCSVTASLLKGRGIGKILIFVFLGNMLVALSYFAGGNGGGAVSCLLGGLQAIVNYFFDKKGKPLPVWLLSVYAVSFLLANLLVFSSLADTVAILASLTFILCIGQKNGKRYRWWNGINVCLWCLYDILQHAWGPLLTHGILLASTFLGMVIYDRKKEKKNER